MSTPEEIKRIAQQTLARLPQPRTDISALNSVRYPGQTVQGNLDQGNRPVVLHPDQGYSTLYSMSFHDGNREILIPTVSLDGKMLSADQAIDNYYKTGQHLGMFDTPDHADVAAQQMHVSSAQKYDPIAADLHNQYDHGNKSIPFQPELTEEEFNKRTPTSKP